MLSTSISINASNAFRSSKRRRNKKYPSQPSEDGTREERHALVIRIIDLLKKRGCPMTIPEIAAGLSGCKKNAVDKEFQKEVALAIRAYREKNGAYADIWYSKGRTADGKEVRLYIYGRVAQRKMYEAKLNGHDVEFPTSSQPSPRDEQVLAKLIEVMEVQEGLERISVITRQVEVDGRFKTEGGKARYLASLINRDIEKNGWKSPFVRDGLRYGLRAKVAQQKFAKAKKQPKLTASQVLHRYLLNARCPQTAQQVVDGVFGITYTGKSKAGLVTALYQEARKEDGNIVQLGRNWFVAREFAREFRDQPAPSTSMPAIEEPASSTAAPETPSDETVEYIRLLEQELAEQSEQLRQAKERSEALMAENARQKEALSNCEDELHQSQVTIDSLKHHINQLTQSSREGACASPELQEALLQVLRGSPTPEQSLLLLETIFPDRVVVLESARESAREARQFRFGAKLFEMLLRLVIDYRDALLAGGGNAQARLVFGNTDTFSAQESYTARLNERARAARTFMYRGQPVEMFAHLKVGKTPGIEWTNRTHFLWDAEEKKIVIGWCGRHLDLL